MYPAPNRALAVLNNCAAAPLLVAPRHALVAPRATLSLRSMSTDDIFRARLLAKETSLRALSKKYLAFVNSLDSASEEEVQAAHQALTKDLAAYEFAMVKARTLIDTSGRQVGDYVQMSKAIEAEMAHTREDIERLTGQLQHERTVRELSLIHI